MINDFKGVANRSSGFPATNADLMNSTAHRGGQDFIVTCESHTLASSHWLPNRIRYIHCRANAPVMVMDDKLRTAVAETTEVTLDTIGDFKARYRENSNLQNRPLCVGGFLTVRHGDQSPRQFLIRQNHGDEVCQWSQPRRLVSANPFQSLLQGVVEECGLIAVNDRLRQAMVIVPDARMAACVHSALAEAAKSVNALKIKQVQESFIRRALAAQGMGDYGIEYRPVALAAMKKSGPRKDHIFLSYPGEAALRHPQCCGETEEDIKAYCVRDAYGTVHLNMAFQLDIPATFRLVTVDPQGQGRDTRLFSPAGLDYLRAAETLSRSMRDYLGRPVVETSDQAAPFPLVTASLAYQARSLKVGA